MISYIRPINTNKKNGKKCKIVRPKLNISIFPFIVFQILKYLGAIKRILKNILN